MDAAHVVHEAVGPRGDITGTAIEFLQSLGFSIHGFTVRHVLDPIASLKVWPMERLELLRSLHMLVLGLLMMPAIAPRRRRSSSWTGPAVRHVRSHRWIGAGVIES